MALPHDAMGLSAVCDCGIFRSYSLKISLRNLRPWSGITMPPWSWAELRLSFDISACCIGCGIGFLDRCGICGHWFRKVKSILILVGVKRFFAS